VKLIEICIEQNYFSLNKKCYQENCYLLVGNPHSKFLVDIFMSFLETHISYMLTSI
jgi:hypothetical protein